MINAMLLRRPGITLKPTSATVVVPPIDQPVSVKVFPILRRQVVQIDLVGCKVCPAFDGHVSGGYALNLVV